jgi:hypothetical protein
MGKMSLMSLFWTGFGGTSNSFKSPLYDKKRGFFLKTTKTYLSAQKE